MILKIYSRTVNVQNDHFYRPNYVENNRKNIFWGQELDYFCLEPCRENFRKIRFFDNRATDGMGNRNSRTDRAIKPIFNRKHVPMVLEISAKFHPDLSSFA